MNSPIKVEIKDNLLTISVSISDLDKILELGDFKITNPKKFALDMATELTNEEDDGTSPLHIFLEDMANEAIENGSQWVEEINEEN